MSPLAHIERPLRVAERPVSGPVAVNVAVNLPARGSRRATALRWVLVWRREWDSNPRPDVIGKRFLSWLPPVPLCSPRDDPSCRSVPFRDVAFEAEKRRLGPGRGRCARPCTWSSSRNEASSFKSESFQKTRIVGEPVAGMKATGDGPHDHDLFSPKSCTIRVLALVRPRPRSLHTATGLIGSYFVCTRLMAECLRERGLNIYVGNLSFDTRDEGLTAAFAQYGQVESARVIQDRDTGRSRGFAFVEMNDEDEAKAAIEALNGTELDGRQLTVNVARPRSSGGGGDRGDRNRW